MNWFTRIMLVNLTVAMVKITAGRVTRVIDMIGRLPPGAIARIVRGGITSLSVVVEMLVMHARIVIRTD